MPCSQKRKLIFVILPLSRRTSRKNKQFPEKTVNYAIAYLEVHLFLHSHTMRRPKSACILLEH